MEKVRNNTLEYPLHQSIIKLVYEMTLTNQPQALPNVHILIEENGEEIPLKEVMEKNMKDN